MAKAKSETSAKVKTAAPAKKAAPVKKAAPAEKAPAKEAAPGKKAAAGKKAAPAAKASAAKAAPAAKAASAAKAAPAADMKKYAKRADLGAAIDDFFTKQPAALRPIADELRKLIDEVAPDAESSIKWGMPFYMLGDAMLCAIGAHKAHVNLILSGPVEAFHDPKKRLTGEGKTGRHLRITKLKDLPREEVRGWLKSSLARARAGE